MASIGPGFGWGYSRSKGHPIDDKGQPVDATTSLWMMPMHVSAIVRFDGPLRRWNIPVVPYGKIGFGFGIWSASGPTGTSRVPTDDPNKTVLGRGNSMGMHLALGGAVSLNAFDPSSAIRLRESTGIRYVNLYGEWMWANLDGIGSRPQMHIGSSTVVVGLAVDFLSLWSPRRAKVCLAPPKGSIFQGWDTATAGCGLEFCALWVRWVAPARRRRFPRSRCKPRPKSRPNDLPT